MTHRGGGVKQDSKKLRKDSLEGGLRHQTQPTVHLVDPVLRVEEHEAAQPCHVSLA